MAVGHSVSGGVTFFGRTPKLTGCEPVGKPVGKPVGEPVGKPVGEPVGKPVGKPRSHA